MRWTGFKLMACVWWWVAWSLSSDLPWQIIIPITEKQPSEKPTNFAAEATLFSKHIVSNHVNLRILIEIFYHELFQESKWLHSTPSLPLSYHILSVSFRKKLSTLSTFSRRSGRRRVSPEETFSRIFLLNFAVRPPSFASWSTPLMGNLIQNSI